MLDMLREARREGWFFPIFLAIWIAIIVVAFVIVTGVISRAVAAPKVKKPEKPAAEQCAVIPPEAWDKLRKSGIEYEHVTNPAAVALIAAAIAASTDKPFPKPTSLVIIFIGEEARIGILVKNTVCAVLTGPAAAVRAMMVRVHGRSVGGYDERTALS